MRPRIHRGERTPENSSAGHIEDVELLPNGVWVKDAKETGVPSVVQMA